MIQDKMKYCTIKLEVKELYRVKKESELAFLWPKNFTKIRNGNM